MSRTEPHASGGVTLPNQPGKENQREGRDPPWLEASFSTECVALDPFVRGSPWRTNAVRAEARAARGVPAAGGPCAAKGPSFEGARLCEARASRRARTKGNQIRPS